MIDHSGRSHSHEVKQSVQILALLLVVVLCINPSWLINPYEKCPVHNGCLVNVRTLPHEHLRGRERRTSAAGIGHQSYGERVKMTEYCLYRAIKTPSAGFSRLSYYKADIH